MVDESTRKGSYDKNPGPYCPLFGYETLPPLSCKDTALAEPSGASCTKASSGALPLGFQIGFIKVP